ncbi:MAG: sigma-54 dependent transcriptional regulator [Endozoicomonadaceae bacterium]|nr:sigma-54 dependent transcriptional regulator [Endozoicomonadaceae bacterium]
MKNKHRILIIEDNEHQKQLLTTIFGFMSFRPQLVSGMEWKERLRLNTEEYNIILLGKAERRLEILAELNRHYSQLPVIVTGRLGIELRGGVRQQVVTELSDPLTYDKLLDSMHKAQAYRASCRNDGRIGPENQQLFKSIAGSGRRIRQIRSLMFQVMDKNVNVLLIGDSGTGKEIVARELHLNSPKKEGPFVPLNCGAIPPELLESELFGHEKGAFTGAINTRKGRFELAHGGTLFLDEIGDMPLSMQVKLLRVLQERCFERVGGTTSMTADVRIIAATHKNLEKMVEEGTFREDLYYRLNVFPIKLPALHERVEDIPLLISDIIGYIEKENRGSVRFSSTAISMLCEYHWPGNIRELRNLIERLAIMYPMGIIGAEELPEHFHQYIDKSAEGDKNDSLSDERSNNKKISLDDLALLPVNGIDLKEFLSNLEKQLIRQALHNCNNIVARAAEKLKIRRTTLVEKMRKYRLNRYEKIKADLSE